MIGTRPLSNDEVRRVIAAFKGPCALRDRALFVMGIKTGFRISELLSLKVSDVWNGNAVTDTVAVARKHSKEKLAARRVPLHPEAKVAVKEWLEIHGTLPADTYLFESAHRGKPISSVQAWRRFQRAYTDAGLTGKLGTHAMRKTFAHGVYEALGHDLVKTQRAMGHKNMNSTASYLGLNSDAEINEAILSL